MSFAYPFVLPLLMVPLVPLYHIWNRPGPSVAVPFDHSGARPGRGWRFALRLGESLPPAVLGVATLVLAGPQRLGEPRSERMLTNIEFCVDVSGSMTTEFGEGTRYDTSMRAIDDFLAQRAGDAFGLTFFANNVLQWVPLTSDPRRSGVPRRSWTPRPARRGCRGRWSGWPSDPASRP